MKREIATHAGRSQTRRDIALAAAALAPVAASAHYVGKPHKHKARVHRGSKGYHQHKRDAAVQKKQEKAQQAAPAAQ